MRKFILALSTAGSLLLPPAVQSAEQTVFQVVPSAGMRLGGSFEDADTGASRQLRASASPSNGVSATKIAGGRPGTRGRAPR